MQTRREQEFEEPLLLTEPGSIVVVNLKNFSKARLTNFSFIFMHVHQLFNPSWWRRDVEKSNPAGDEKKQFSHVFSLFDRVFEYEIFL